MTTRWARVLAPSYLRLAVLPRRDCQRSARQTDRNAGTAEIRGFLVSGRDGHRRALEVGCEQERVGRGVLWGSKVRRGGLKPAG